MRPNKYILQYAMFVTAVMAVASSARAQIQTTGTPGSPGATTTIDGKQLPPPEPKFGGVIKESATDSKPWWPPTVVPPKGAANVLLIMTDDQGYGVSGTFGGVIPTPAMDRIAKAGLRYTQFHSTALCSPTRAAIITGRNHHSVGFGIIAEQSTGYPGYDSIIGVDNATYPHMSVAWTWAFDTPFKWTKQVASHFGGTRQGMCISWPGHIKDVGGIRTQFHHMIDIVPTILEATGVKAPDIVDGIKQKPIEGVSMAYTFDPPNAEAPSKRDTQYFEMFANRGIYHDGWYACTTPPEPVWLLGAKPLPPVNEYKWELYNIAEDYSQYTDLAAKNPDKLKEMQALFVAEAEKYQVFPLDNSVLTRLLTPRPSATSGRTAFTYSGENPGIPVSSAPSILNKDYTVTAEITVPKGGAEGMIATMGGRFGGYGLYLLKGKPVFTYNLLDLERYRWEGGVGARDWLGRALAPGKHTIVFDFKYDGPGPGKGGTGVMTVDAKEFARKTIPHSIPFLMAIDESFDIGSDTRTGVDDSYKLPFHFTGTIDKLTYKLGPTQMTAEEQKAAAERLALVTD